MKKYVLTAALFCVLLLFICTLLSACALFDPGDGTVLYVRYGGELYCPAPADWTETDGGHDESAWAGFDRKNSGKKTNCTVRVLGNGTFLVFKNSVTGDRLMYKSGTALPREGDADGADCSFLRTQSGDTPISAEQLRSIVSAVMSSTRVSDRSQFCEVGDIYIGYSDKGAARRFGTLSVNSAGVYGLYTEKVGVSSGKCLIIDEVGIKSMLTK